MISLSLSLRFVMEWFAGSSIHAEEAPDRTGEGEGGVHKSGGEHTKGTEDSAAQAGGSVLQGRGDELGGSAEHDPAVPPSDDTNGHAAVPAGALAEGYRVGAP